MSIIKSELDRDKAKEESLKSLEELYQQITDTSECVVPLYDAIESYFFQDFDYQKVKPLIPLWMMDAGRSPESPCDKLSYEQYRSVYDDSVSNRIIHWADVQGVLVALQDRVTAIKHYLKLIYRHLPAYCLYEDYEYGESYRGLDETADKVHMAINNVFVSLCSSFDLFTKVVYECSKYDINNFTEYKALKCRKNNILYHKGNYGFDELKSEGMLYSDPVCVRIARSFRDEFIHNGAWDYRPAIYYPSIAGGEPVEPFVLMPDIEDGNLIKSCSRNKFYAKGDKINVFLVGFVKNVMEVLSKTIKVLIDVLQKRTDGGNRDEATEKARFIMLRNCFIYKKKMMGDRYTDEELVNDIDLLMPNFPFLVSSPTIAELCKGITISKNSGEQLLYSDCLSEESRPYRMLMYVLLLNEAENLKNTPQLAYHLLKEAYLMTDNIYGQLKGTTYPFVLADHLTELENALPNRNSEELHVEEKNIYDVFPEKIKVYRGMCDDEKQSGQFGISWTQDMDEAKKYIFYKENMVKGDFGWCAEMEINKSEIFAVWGVVGEPKEIVINPKKCREVNFVKYTKP